MSVEVLAALRIAYPCLTNAERDIADYVLAHGEEVVYMPITELAFRCSVGVTSIMRFCRRIGRSGYQMFRLELASALEAQRQLTGQSGEEKSDFERLLDSVYQKYSTALQSTRHMLAEDTLRLVVERLMQAHQIYCFGMNRSLSAAISACQFLMTCLHKGYCAIEPYTQLMLADTLSSGDVALFFSNGGTDERLLRLASLTQASGAFSVSMTCCRESPLSRLCSVNLCCGCNANPGRASDLDKLTGKSTMAFLTEILCEACQRAYSYVDRISAEDGETQKNSPEETLSGFYLAE